MHGFSEADECVMASIKVAVCSRSFSANPVLRAELIARYPDTTFNDAGVQLSRESLVQFLRSHEKAIVALEEVSDWVLEQLPELRVIAKYGVGLDKVDVRSMRKRGIRLGWKGGVNRRSVSELVIAFAIAMLRHIPAAHREVTSGIWRQHVGGYLTGRTVGIVGCGHIGKDLVPLLKAFGCRILVNDILDFPEFYAAHRIESVTLERLLADSDIVTLHVPLDDSTKGMLDTRRLSQMKSGAILINAARGGLVDESALKDLLTSRRIAAAAFDVFSQEPPTDQELLDLPNFLATPHIGGSAHEAILAMGRAAIEGLDDNAVPDTV